MLYLITGPMFSGKTSELLRLIDDLVKQGKNVLKISHSIDNRYDKTNDKIISHNKYHTNCVSLSKLDEIFKLDVFETADYVCIDEAQFFHDCKQTLVQILTHNKKVVICGLDTNFRKEPFRNIHELFPICSKIKFLSANCYLCNESAFYTMKTNKSSEEIEVGSSDKYLPVCGFHHSV